MNFSRLKILFVCSQNKRRSLTAEKLFSAVAGWDVRSAGTEERSRIRVTPGLLGWADLVLVMEKRHKERLQQKFPEIMQDKRCLCLRIQDEFEFMEPSLQRLLEIRVRERLAKIGSPMAEEIFDVVNERDEVIGQKPRSEVHRLGLLHRAVHVLVFNSQDHVFLQKRSMRKDRHPGTWDSSASGHVDSGEHYDETAVRELREEIGLTARQPLRRLFKIDACDETDQEFVWIYQCESEGPFELNPDEIECGEWFETAKVDAWIQERPQEFAPAFVFLWKKFRKSA